MFSGDFFFCKF